MRTCRFAHGDCAGGLIPGFGDFHVLLVQHTNLSFDNPILVTIRFAKCHPDPDFQVLVLGLRSQARVVVVRGMPYDPVQPVLKLLEIMTWVPGT
jgi:hypothetical protein